MNNYKKTIINLVKLTPVLAIILISISLVSIAILGVQEYFDEKIKKEEQQIRYETIYGAKKRIKAAYSVISNMDLLIKRSFKREVKASVEVGYGILEDIYNQKENKDNIIKEIKKHLSGIRFYNDKSGYFFIYDMNANLIMLPIKPELEGKNFWNYKDVDGRYVLRDFIKGLKTNPNGVYSKWSYYKPNGKVLYEKLGYVKYFKPLNILIGSAVYEDKVKSETYKRIRQMISKINTIIQRKDLTIIDDKKIVYATIMRKYQMFKKYEDIMKIVRQNPDKLMEFKKDNEFLIFDYYKPLNLIIVERIDLNELEGVITKKKEEVYKIVNRVIKRFLYTSIIFIVIVLFITMYITSLIRSIFNKYDEALNSEKEKAQNAAKVKSEFLANMSHEIRTPLNAMFGFIKILQEKDLDKESKKYLNIIEKSGENLLMIINDILDFSKMESGKFNIEKIEFNPKEEISVIKELFASKASEKDILIEYIEKNIKYNIISDPTRIKQVIANLLSNAIKFTPTGKKIMLILKYDENNEELYVEVKDEGIGIPKNKQQTIFDAFSQADNSTTRKYGGTGLGLTISYRLVSLLGGELKVRSEENKGSSFYFSIPAKKVSKLKEVITKKDNISDIKFDYKLLLVEDNLANQMFMKIILQKMGLKFDIANNGKEAVEKFENSKYDFILMDENMPIMNGIEATKEIRELERKNNLNHTIIIALTANALEGDKERFILAGMDYYLSKPLDIEKLKKILVRLKVKNDRF